MAELGVIIGLLLVGLGSVVGEYCTETYHSAFYGSTRVRTFHCSFGCCGPSYDEYCCISNAGIIVGIVFAGIFGIALITAIICCFIKQKSSRGRTVRPVTTATVAYAGHNTAQPNVFVVPSGPAPPAYSSVAYSTTFTNSYGTPAPAYVPPAAYPYGGGPSAPMPPAYGQPGAAPPAYSYSDPAYPPKFTSQHTPVQ